MTDLPAAVFVQSRIRPPGSGPYAPMLSAAGWAHAAERRLGAAWIRTPLGWETPNAVRSAATGEHADARPGRAAFIPDTAKTLLKDIRSVRRARTFNRSADLEPPGGSQMSFVWQRHDPFVDLGYRIAAHNSAPCVLSVHALHVDEARSWGVARPLWGSVMQRYGELQIIERADLVTVVSPALEMLIRQHLSTPPPIIQIGAGIDPERFHPSDDDRQAVRESLGFLPDTVVIGWHGSFRSFHGLDSLLRAVKRRTELQDTRLLLIGHGPHRYKLQRLASDLGLEDRVTWTGEVSHERIPFLLRALDVGVVLATTKSAFHYSPLKLREYQASGVPVVASRAGVLCDLEEPRQAILAEPGDVDDLATALSTLVSDSGLRQELSLRGQDAARAVSWDAHLDELLHALASIAR